MAQPTHSADSAALLAQSYPSTSPLAQASLARDILEEGDDSLDPEQSSSTTQQTLRRARSHDASAGYSMSGSYRRPSYLAMGGARSTIVPSTPAREGAYLTAAEQDAVREEERSLLRDNDLLPPKHPRRGSDSTPARSKGVLAAIRQRLGSMAEETEAIDEEERPALNETTPLLAAEPSSLPYGGQDSPEQIDQKWEDAVMSGQIHTTWQRETKVLARYSRSLILTFILQYSLPVTSIFTVGHIGKHELGAVSLGSMTASITGYAIYQGLATSLDTLCAQAYGSGRKKLVGLQLQRAVFFLWLVTIPIAAVWVQGDRILARITPEPEIAALAGKYLRIVALGAPAYAAFECGKRFVQAQGLFSATLYCLLIVAPLNMFLHWFLVWHLGWGFIGAPIAVTITENLLPVCLFAYVYFVDGRECWGGFSRAALRNWGPMIKLALPGLVMVVAEFLAFEILTLSASWIDSTHLAAQSVLSSLTALTFQIPFPISIAASTRVANLIGATLAPAAKISARVALGAACIVGVFNMLLLSAFKEKIPRLYTNDEEVAELVAAVLPLCAAFQLFDALAAVCNGILRGIGRQEVGGYIALFSYYAVAMPVSIGTCFGLGWKLYGLWAGPAIALGLVSAIEGFFIFRTSWERAVEEAHRRNLAA